MKLISLTIPVISSDPKALITFTIESETTTVEAHTLESTNPCYAIALGHVTAYQAGTLTLEALATALSQAVSPGALAAAKFTRFENFFDNRLTLDQGHVFIDGDQAPMAVEAYILRLLAEDGTPTDAAAWTAFGRFLTKLYSNQTSYVREQFFGWLDYETKHGAGFTIAEDGDVIGYKGLGGTVDAPVSINHGSARVNGVEYNGAIPNPVGALVEMPRSAVQDNPAIGCSAGLHIGTFAYAQSWAKGVLSKVKFSPADIVSVPTECKAQKIRVWRYEVLELIDAPDTRPVAHKPVAKVSAIDDKLVQANSKLLKKALKKGKKVTFLYGGSKRTLKVEKLSTGPKGANVTGKVKNSSSSTNWRTYALANMKELKLKK